MYLYVLWGIALLTFWRGEKKEKNQNICFPRKVTGSHWFYQVDIAKTEWSLGALIISLLFSPSICCSCFCWSSLEQWPQKPYLDLERCRAFSVTRLIQHPRAPGNPLGCLPALCAQLMNKVTPAFLYSQFPGRETESSGVFYFLGERKPIHIIFLSATTSYTDFLSGHVLKLSNCKPLPAHFCSRSAEKDVLSSNHKTAEAPKPNWQKQARWNCAEIPQLQPCCSEQAEFLHIPWVWT